MEMEIMLIWQQDFSNCHLAGFVHVCPVFIWKKKKGIIVVFGFFFRVISCSSLYVGPALNWQLIQGETGIGPSNPHNPSEEKAGFRS